MAGDGEQQSSYPLAPAHGHVRSHPEAAAPVSADRRKRKRAKCWLYVLVFALLQTGIIVLFALTVMQTRTPKFRLRSATFASFDIGTRTNPYLNVTMRAELGVKNANFGRFKFGNTYVYFFHGETQVARVLVQRGRANWRSTKKFDAAVDMSVVPSAGGNSRLASDLAAGVVPIRSQAEMRGNVRQAMGFEKKRTAEMNCTMEIVTATRQLQNVVCN